MNSAVILYDGCCVFCSSTIAWVLKHDGGYFRIAMQGSRFFNECVDKGLIPLAKRKSDETVYLLADGLLYARTDALIHILRKCGRVGQWYALLLLCLPRFVRDMGYRCIAGMRNKLSPTDRCPVPTAEQRARMV